ncbi:uncharacterized protein LOC143508651 [Brachyhypopomus gauderio]|uniref:uncharacterized protein LOC143508651 n=1 Tax=Brachyhypopomus gauderio TaxID=698409 RepID=UPI0040418F17
MLPPPAGTRHTRDEMLPPPAGTRHTRDEMLPPPAGTRHMCDEMLPPPAGTRHETLPPAATRTSATEATTGPTRRLSLPGYDGEADWAAFEAQLDAVANYESWSDAETAVQLCLVLRGPALRVLVGLPAEDRNALTPLKAALRSRFGRQPDESTAKQLLAGRRRARGEGLRVLASELALLVRLAYPLFPREAQRQLELDFFLGAVEPAELRRHVRPYNPTTLDAAVDEAVRAEQIFTGDCLNRMPRQTRPHDRQASHRLVCWNCGAHGHKASQCNGSGNEQGAAR